MIPLDDARAHVLERCPPGSPATVPLAEAVGCVVASDVVTRAAVPPFDNSAVDGFAVRSADVAGASDQAPVRLRVAGTVAAGAVYEGRLATGEAVRIMTGAPIPDGADAVVMVERSRVTSDGEVEILEPVTAHAGIRDAGDDLRPGDVVVAGGAVVRPGHLGVLASVGLAAVEVVRPPVVGVLSTGDELVPPGRPLGPGQIHDANREVLLSLVRASGFAAVDLGLVPDDEAAVAAALTSGAGRCDALLTSGGVSMGDFDVVKVVLDRLADMRWMQIAIRPAKPFAFGVLAGRGVPVFGLPGNPVSSMVSFELLARPALRRMAGHRALDRPRVRAVAGADLRRRPDGKVHLPRVQVHHDGERFVARPVGAQASHQLAATAGANGLAVVPDGNGLLAGDEVEVVLLDAVDALGGA